MPWACGVLRCLVVPPFFFKDVPDDAVFAFFAGLIDAVDDPRLRLYLYHIPQFSGVAVRPDRRRAARRGVPRRDRRREGQRGRVVQHRGAARARARARHPGRSRAASAAADARRRRGHDLRRGERVSGRSCAPLLARDVAREDEARIEALHRRAVPLSLPARVQGDQVRAGRRCRLARGAHALAALRDGAREDARRRARIVRPRRAEHGRRSNEPQLSREALAALAAFDTPTICNALELVVPATQGSGYTQRPLVCGFPDQAPIVGYARTATHRAPGRRRPRRAAELRALRAAYYRYVEAGPRPSIVVIEDLDGADAGYGAFWGEVQSAIHRGLGAVGLVTNGSVRDLAQWAPGFQFLAGRSRPRMRTPRSWRSARGHGRWHARARRRSRPRRSPRRRRDARRRR